MEELTIDRCEKILCAVEDLWLPYQRTAKEKTNFF